MLNKTEKEKHQELGHLFDVYFANPNELLQLMYFFSKGLLQHAKEHTITDAEYDEAICHLDFMSKAGKILH